MKFDQDEYEKARGKDLIAHYCGECDCTVMRKKTNIQNWLRRGFSHFLCDDCRKARNKQQTTHVCLNCGQSFTRSGQAKFCSHSCSAIYNNPKKATKKTKKCKNCTKLILGYQTFCCYPCYIDYLWTQTQNKFKDGNIKGRRQQKDILKRLGVDSCMECGLNIWRGQLLPLEIDHIDGNASNNKSSNIRLVCPNCHSITPTWKGKNRGSGRKSRGLPLS